MKHTSILREVTERFSCVFNHTGSSFLYSAPAVHNHTNHITLQASIHQAAQNPLFRVKEVLRFECSISVIPESWMNELPAAAGANGAFPPDCLHQRPHR